MLRSQQVANSPELIRRLGVIAMNTPLEVDIVSPRQYYYFIIFSDSTSQYAHANSTNALGSRMLNGLGGSADFLRNAKLSIMHTPSRLAFISVLLHIAYILLIVARRRRTLRVSAVLFHFVRMLTRLVSHRHSPFIQY